MELGGCALGCRLLVAAPFLMWFTLLFEVAFRFFGAAVVF